MILWRISNHAVLDGEGGKLFPGRWHSGGRAVIYASDHPASCLCEMLVHLDAGEIPDSIQLLKLNTHMARISDVTKLPEFWSGNTLITQSVGNQWLDAMTSPILRVPSAIVPECHNYLINPAQVETGKILIESAVRVPLDPRLQ